MSITSDTHAHIHIHTHTCTVVGSLRVAGGSTSIYFDVEARSSMIGLFIPSSLMNIHISYELYQVILRSTSKSNSYNNHLIRTHNFSAKHNMIYALLK